MTRRLTPRILLCVAFATLTAPLSAQFFSVVYDPTNYANAVLRYQELQQQLEQRPA